jgi:hypothetical protein
MDRKMTIALAALVAAALAAAPAVAKDKPGKAKEPGAPAVSTPPPSQMPVLDSKIALLTPDCALIDGCRFSGNDKSAEVITSAYEAAFPLSQLSLSFLQKVEFAGSQYSGGWTSAAPVSFVSVKAGNEFMLYQLAAPATSGLWSTAGLVNKNLIPHAVSHISLWSGTFSSGVPLPPTVDDPLGDAVDDMRGAIPEPATWAMMILGFGAIGAILRRRARELRAA